jgi:hypothetical protein
MLQNIHLKGVGPAPELSLDFAPRLNLLTGDNGLGKSFVLDLTWWALTGSWTGLPARPREDADSSLIEYTALALTGKDHEAMPSTIQSTYSLRQETWLEEGERPSPSASLVLYAHVDGSFSMWHSLRNITEPKAGSAVGTPKIYRFTASSILDGLVDDHKLVCKGMIRDWVAWQKQNTEAFLQLREVLHVFSPEGEELRPGEPTRVSLYDTRDHPTLKTPYGRLPLIFTSSGMRRITSLAYLIVWAWQEHQRAAKLLHEAPAGKIVFLIDEIECHLHPKWQRLILPALLKVAASLQSSTQVQSLVTTHSPLVLASAEPLFDEDQDALFTFDLRDAQVEVSRADWRSRGDASSWLTSDIFDLGEARSVEAEQAIQQAKEAMRRPDISVEERRRIHHELHEVLKDTDPFWGRWLVQAKAAGIEP